ncbi:MAG: class I SAM-dependent methyltransferase [Halioglobus sp.]|nr:class I SAM-dependent methyltransferase [Halioglobus sp.]
MCRHLGRDSLADLSVLDMGCGTKLVQAMLDRDLPVGRYVGLDVYSEMIDYLQANVDDKRFTFHRLEHTTRCTIDREPLTPIRDCRWKNTVST